MKKLILILLFSFFIFHFSFGQIDTAWVSRSNFPDAISSTAYNVEINASGNVFSCGVGDDDNHPNDHFYLMKQHTDGSIEWIQYFGGDTTTVSGPYDMCLDQSGNAWVVYQQLSPVKIYIQKFSGSNGAPLWHTSFERSLFNGFEWRVRPKYLTSAGNFVYVAGTEFGLQGTDSEMLAIKIDISGSVAWTETHSGSGVYANAKSIAVDDAGNVYITGDAWNSTIDYCTVRFDANGNFLWDAFQDGLTYSSTDIAQKVIVDSNGNVYVTGFSRISENQTDILTVKYDNNGNFQWNASYGNPDYTTNNAYFLDTDASGNLYVGGYNAYQVPYPGSGKDYCLLKYTPSGSLLWDRQWDHINYLEDHPFDFKQGPDGNIYICGITKKYCYSWDFITVVKYNEQGDLQWRFWVPGLFGIPWEISVIDNDEFVVAGGSYDTIMVEDATTVKYHASNPPFYEADILDVYFESQIGPPVIDYENRRVIATVHDTANIEFLVPYITRSEHSCMYPEDEVVTSFIEPIWYNITSFDEETEKWWYVIVEGGYVDISEKDLKGNIQVYPNPTRGECKVHSSQFTVEFESLELIDIYGKVLISNNNRTIEQLNSGTFELNMSHLPAGIYFIRIKLENHTIVKKIIKL